jgi:SAM-dependent methyltransferase
MKLALEVAQCCVCGGEDSEILVKGRDYQYATSKLVFVWVKCVNCSHLFLNPRPQSSALSTIYPSTLLNYSPELQSSIAWRVKRNLEIRSFRKLISKHFDSPPTSVLDVGCGSGEYLNLLKSNLIGLKKVHGTEISEIAGKSAAAKGLDVLVGTIEEIRIEEKYDVIFLKQVIEHNPELVIKKLLMALEVNGKMIIETPLANSWDQKFFSFFPGAVWEGFHIPRHFNVWSQKNFYALVSNCGGRVVSSAARPKPVHWTISIQNLIRLKFPKSKSRFAFNPIFLSFFYLIDVIQIWFKRGSDIQYVVSRDA